MAINWPVTPAVGATVEGPRGEIWKWDGVKWVSVVGPGGGGGANVSTGVVPPVNPNVGDLWFDPVEGQMYIWFNDGTSSQWVVTINQGGAGGGAGPSGPQMGVTDGSNAAPGEIGEFKEGRLDSILIYTNGQPVMAATLALTAGDWLVIGCLNFYQQTTATSWGAQMSVTSDSDIWDVLMNVPDPMVTGSVNFGAVPSNLTLTSMARVNLSAVGAAYLWAVVNGANIRSTSGWLHAWRMR